MHFDSIITTSDKLVSESNSYIVATEIFDPDLIVRGEVFKLEGTDLYFLDLVFSLNRVYRRRLSLDARTVVRNKGRRTKTFKTQEGVLKAAINIGVNEIRIYLDSRATDRARELSHGE